MRDAVAVYCDDVRREIGNKLSLIGVYQNVLYVPEIPITLPKLCILITVRTPLTMPLGSLKFELLKGDERIAEAVASITPQGDFNIDDPEDKYMSFGAMLQLMPFEISEQFSLRSLVTADDDVIRAGELLVRKTLTDHPEKRENE